MVNEIEYSGEWWLPEKPDLRAKGTLSFKLGITSILRLVIDYRQINLHNDFPFSDSYPIIIGEGFISSDVHKEKVTLLGCNLIESLQSISKDSYSIHTIDKILLGRHFLREEDIRFRSIAIRFSWFDGSQDYQKRMESLDIPRVLVDPYFKFPPLTEEHKTKINDNTSISILDYNLYEHRKSEYLEKGRKNIRTFKSEQMLKIETQTATSIENYLRTAHYFKMFTSLLNGFPSYLIFVLGVLDNGVRILLLSNDRIDFSLIKVSHVLRDFYIGRVNDIFGKYKLVIENSQEIGSVLRLFETYEYNKDLNLELAFVTLANALEAYHRHTFTQDGGKFLREEQYKEIKNKILKNIKENTNNKGFIDSWEGKLEFGNQYSLRKRLKDLFVAFNEILRDYDRKPSKAVNRIVEIRNYYTHYEKKENMVIPDRKELRGMIRKLRFILRICLLNYYGFSIEEIKIFAPRR